MKSKEPITAHSRRWFVWHVKQLAVAASVQRICGRNFRFPPLWKSFGTSSLEFRVCLNLEIWESFNRNSPLSLPSHLWIWVRFFFSEATELCYIMAQASWLAVNGILYKMSKNMICLRYWAKKRTKNSQTATIMSNFRNRRRIKLLASWMKNTIIPTKINIQIFRPCSSARHNLNFINYE